MAYVDSERCYKYVNKEHEVWYGVEGEYAQGKHIWEVVGEEDYHKMQTYIDTALSGERVFYDIELPSKGGEKHYFYMVMVPEIDERGTVMSLTTLCDTNFGTDNNGEDWH
jgi:PAS domain S-box-containing protein